LLLPVVTAAAAAAAVTVTVVVQQELSKLTQSILNWIRKDLACKVGGSLFFTLKI